MSQKRKVVLSGVSSFVGCHLAKAFADAGWALTVLISKERSEYDGIREKRLSFIEADVAFKVCDVTDGLQVSTLIDEIKPQLWIQHAGYATNYGSLDYDLETSFKVNVLALKPIYEALAKVGACCIVTGTNAEYGPNKVADLETDACWPKTPYGVSKLAETMEAKRLGELYRVPTRIARIYIPIGPLDAPGKLMDHVIANLKKGQVVDLSPCLQKRDFLGVEDIAKAYVLLADDMARSPFDLFNICSGEAFELKGLLKIIAHNLGQPESLLNFGAFPMRMGEELVSYGSNEKARKILGWTPVSTQDRLAKLVKS